VPARELRLAALDGARFVRGGDRSMPFDAPSVVFVSAAGDLGAGSADVVSAVASRGW
jgi:hypothetical protein